MIFQLLFIDSKFPWITKFWVLELCISHLLKSSLGTACGFLWYIQQLKVSSFVLMEDCSSSEISMDKWLTAEHRVQEILWAVQPNVASEWRRRELIDYVQRIIKGHFGTEVLSFGSVPLKTYLPDGDIDLTVLCHRNQEEDLARAICSRLQGEPKEPGFLVEDVKYVYAKVKIIKCTVNNIAVDISFNQVAGLCTLCFLEQVDQVIGRDHLFKKSIILIKAWCYYESRTVGAPHGLISTYALETLVLYIINLFHSSLHGPLQVLHIFLEYYSKFDWTNYCISINGPVSLSSVLKIRENEGENLLFTKEFLKKCRVAFSDPRRISEARLQEFPIKCFNVVDPLKDNNNLGRSVTSGNFTRIKSAFAFGENELRRILALPGESIGQELQKDFFRVTLNRNGRGQRPDLQAPVPAFGSGRYVQSNLTGDFDYYYGGILYAQWLHDESLHLSSHPSPPPSQVQNNTTWNARTWSVNVFDQMSMNARALPFYHHCASQQTAHIRTLPGTGMYIPDPSPHYRQMYSRARGRNESKNRRVMMKPPQKVNQSETSTGVHVSSIDLSLEEVPHLPGIQPPPPPQVSQSGKPWPSLQSQVPPQTNEDHKLGVLGPASLPLGMHSLEAKADSCSSYASTEGPCNGNAKSTSTFKH
ncbi:uncharacterized protein LOC133718452 isoform X2 [Rosa rugosa]|uniref:uncharacterized protein LOC133718452 isoform X2 n=1 Tax=Rosa rugosa TaxID=74645 RepID=UPI002B40E395|nr:uncharacterized protein LOC133718452 isoform X2 [Rosa rugosa]